MEKIKVGLELASKISDPPIILMSVIPFIACSSTFSAYCVVLCTQTLDSTHYFVYLISSIVPWACIYIFWNFYYHTCAREHGVDTSEFLVWTDATSSHARQYRYRRIPIACFYESYISGEVSFNPACEKGDCYLILKKHRHKFLNWKISYAQIKWLIAQFLPKFVTGSGLGVGSSSGKSKSDTLKEIKEHYDRGNASFSAMLGRSMIYTCALFETMPKFASDYDGDYAKSANDETLEAAQHNKMRTICDKLMLQNGESLLDIGCGWGTLLRHSVLLRGAEATGVTLSVQGRDFCDFSSRNMKIPTTTLLMDYRDIPESSKKYDKICSIEMAEHVGLANFTNPYISKVKNLMKGPDSRFCLQVSGLKKGASWEDMAWGLFMSKYIFPGADASTPLNWYIRQCENAGLELISVENIGGQYSLTLHKWYDMWMSNKDKIMSGDTEPTLEPEHRQHLFRLQELFLAWSTIASEQGSATCYQMILKKNVYESTRFYESPAGSNSTKRVAIGAELLAEITPSLSQIKEEYGKHKKKD